MGILIITALNFLLLFVTITYSRFLLPDFPVNTTDSSVITASTTTAKCANVTCTWKLWAHYLEMGCEPVTPDGLCCPTKFLCPSFIAGDEEGCRRRGRILPVGESVEHSNPCQKCMCRGTPHSSPSIECMHIECPEIFSPPEPGCKLLYKPNECCAAETRCTSPDDLEPKQVGITCTFENKTFIEGEKIIPKDDQCTVCTCQEGFAGITGPGCSKVDNCFVENQNALQRGCVPVYHVDSCCPVDWKCPRTRSSLPLTLEDGVCTFDDRTYALNEKLDIFDSCTKCTCTTPPQFTCIQSRCL